MSIPFTKGIYEFGNIPGGDSVEYARGLRCDSIVMRAQDGRDDDYRRAVDAGLAVYVYRGPAGWHADTWQRTHMLCESLVTRNRLAGYLVNLEPDRDHGLTHERAEVMAATFASASVRTSVILASYPTLPKRELFKRGRIVGSPELYGIRSPATYSEFRRRFAMWRGFPGGLVASLAAWGRSPTAFRSYLSSMRSMAPAALFWLGPRAWHLRDPRSRALADWRPGGGGGGIGAAAAAVAALVIVGGAIAAARFGV